MIADALAEDDLVESVIEASDGQQAIGILASEQPDIVVTDWEMPGLNGIELCRWIRHASLSHYVYTILLTAKTGVKEMIEGLEAGADDFVSKPLNAATLRARVQAGRRIVTMERALRELSDSDPLTGVLNRRAFRNRFALEWERSTRYGHPLAAVMVDLDFFKKINDTHGHAAGDLAIISVARILRDRRRSSDLVCRYGGEEFCILLPHTDENGAEAWAERCRRDIEALTITAGQDSFRLSASLGVSERKDDLVAPEGLIDLADQALAVAKASGRNRVVCYGRLEDSIPNLATIEGPKGPLDRALAKDVMTEAVVCPHESETIQWVTDIFLQLRLSSAPVIDQDGRLVGIVSETDLMSATATGDNWHRPVGEIMRSQVVSFDEHSPVKEVFRFFSRASVRRVVIVKEGRPTGVISRANLLRWFRNWSTVHGSNGGEEGDQGSPADRNDRFAAISRLLETAEQRASAVRHGLFDAASDPLPPLVGEATRLQELADSLLGHCRSVAR